MKTWILKFISAMGMTALILLLLLGVYAATTYLSDSPRDKVEFVATIAATAIYIHFRDYVDRVWKKEGE